MHAGGKSVPIVPHGLSQAMTKHIVVRSPFMHAWVLHRSWMDRLLDCCLGARVDGRDYYCEGRLVVKGI